MPEPAEKPHFSRGADSNTGTHLLHPLQHRYAPTPPTPTQVRTYSTHSNTGTHLLHPLQHRYAPTPPTPTLVHTYSTHSNTGMHPTPPACYHHTSMRLSRTEGRDVIFSPSFPTARLPSSETGSRQSMTSLTSFSAWSRNVDTARWSSR